MATKYFNQDCPICLCDDKKGMKILNCKHRLHVECSKGMGELKCPICSAVITNFSKVQTKKVTENKKKYKNQDIEEEERQIREMLNSERPSEENDGLFNNLMRSFLRSPDFPGNVIRHDGIIIVFDGGHLSSERLQLSMEEHHILNHHHDFNVDFDGDERLLMAENFIHEENINEMPLEPLVRYNRPPRNQNSIEESSTIGEYHPHLQEMMAPIWERIKSQVQCDKVKYDYIEDSSMDEEEQQRILDAIERSVL